ncbi:MAG TPA: hypothetical protein VI455_04190, partial [Terriglobia bacterium]
MTEEQAGRVKVVPDAAGETLSVRVLGLEVARIELGSVPKVYFGLEGTSRLAGDAGRAGFDAFLEGVLRLRRARTANRSHPFYRLQPERWLESLLVEDIGRVDPAFVPEHVYPQVPAFSGPATPGLSRGVIDILVYRFIEVYPLLGEGCERLEFLPTMDHRTSINFCDPLENAIAEFLPR